MAVNRIRVTDGFPERHAIEPINGAVSFRKNVHHPIERMLGGTTFKVV